MSYEERILLEIREWSEISNKIHRNPEFTEKEQHYLMHLIARKNDELLDRLENIRKLQEDDLY